jgi:Fic family protein
MATRKEKQEVLNYLNVLQNIQDYQNDGKVTEKLLLKLHKDITKETLDLPSDEENYRKVQVVVGNKFTGEVVFTPPKTEKVPQLTKALLEWINQEIELHPVLIAGLSHYEFVRIHPFVDGNGRTARALATLILYIRDFDIKRFFTLDDYYDSDRKAYYAALKSVDKNTLDTTQWIEYFTDGVLISINEVKKKILSLSIKKSGPQIALTERQMKIMEKIVANGKITSGEIQDMFKISRQAAYKELKKMIELGVIEPRGEGKAVYYIAKAG